MANSHNLGAMLQKAVKLDHKFMVQNGNIIPQIKVYYELFMPEELCSVFQSWMVCLKHIDDRIITRGYLFCDLSYTCHKI